MEEEFKKGKFLFLSYDIVNSTLYKYRHLKWASLYKKIFETLHNEIKSSGFKKWKINGDELLYIKEYIECNLSDDIKKADCIMTTALRKIHEDNELRRDFNDIKQISLKSTMWIANIKDINNSDNDEKGTSDVSIEWNDKIDYFGKETDTGFRISTLVPRSKTGISAAIMYVLFHKDDEILKNIKLLGYSSLKGIWNNKKYPIFIYIRELKKNKIVRSFHYDEKDNEFISQFIKKMEEGKYKDLDKEDFIEMLDYIGVKESYQSEF